MPNPNEKQKMIQELKDQLITRGVDPEPYISVLLSFQKLVDSLVTHDQIEIAGMIVQAITIVLKIKHERYHEKGGRDEKGYSNFN